MRWQTLTAPLALGVASLALLGGCSAGATRSPSAPPTPALFSTSSAPSPTVAAALPSIPSPAPLAPSRDPAVASAPTATGSFSGQVVTTLADEGLRVRSQPRISDDSDKRDPLLPLGTQLLVLDGPVSASGYAWYEVVPLTARTLPGGWIASADRNGQPWIATTTFDCPPVPTDVRSLAALAPGVGLACFSRVPITVQARLISCNCDSDGSWYTPSWFFLGSGSPNLLVEPAVTSAPPDVADWFALNLDPEGSHPAALPVGKVVQVTGMFDHPAAASCTETEMDGEPVPSQGCRLEFAVTRLLAQEP